MRYDEEYDDDYMVEEAKGPSLKGYKIVVLLLAVILVAVSGLYFYQSQQLRADFAIERDTLTNRILSVRNSLAGMQTTNEELNLSIAQERGRTDSVLEALARERSMTRATIRKYEKELGTMRQVMAGYIYTIDSLGRLNQRLASENITIKREIASERLRADAAEERASDAEVKIRQGSVVMARDLRLVLLNDRDKEVTRAGRASRLRVDCVLSANNIANPGLRNVYARVTGPEGFVLAGAGAASFDYEGEALVYTAVREVDYQNSDLPVGIYWSGSLTAGLYKVQIFMDGVLIGSSETLLR